MDSDSALEFLTGQPSGPTLEPLGKLDATNFVASPTASVTDTNQPLLPAPEIPDINKEFKERYLKQNQAPGITLDPDTGASPWERFWVGSMRDKETALSYMQQKYGPKNVRYDKQGDFIFRVPDPENPGSEKDIKFSPNSITLGDFAALASAVPEAAASVLAIIKGRQIPKIGAMKGIGGVARDTLLGAAGAETAGAVKDVALNTLERGQPDIGETLQERGKMAAQDVAIGAGTYGAGRVFKFLASPFARKRGQVQIDMERAREFFKNNPAYDVDVPVTASEATGNPLLGRAEVYTELQPGGYGPLKALKAEQEAALQDLQKKITGIAPPVSDEEIARRVENALAPAIEAQEQAVRGAAKDLATAGEQRVQSLSSQLSTPTRELYRDVVGRQVRQGVLARQQAAMDVGRKLYADADALGAKDYIIDGTGLQNSFRKILSGLPKAEVDKIVMTPGPMGIPTPSTVRASQRLESWPPSRIIQRLQEITSLKNPKFSVSDLKQMRSDIYDDLQRGEGVPDLGAHYLGEIAKSIGDEMEKAVSKLPGGQLKAALQVADKHWKEKVVPFNRPGITELFRREGEQGFIPDDEIISRIFTTASSPSVTLHNYDLLKQTLGPASPEWLKVKRTLLDHLIESSRDNATGFIDPQQLSKTLTDLRTRYRTVSDDIFGTKLNDFFREAKLMDYGPLKSTGYVQEAKLAPEQLQQLLSDPSPTTAKLRAMVVAQRKLDDTYRNDILKQVSQNKISGGLNPSEFVSRFVNNPATKLSDLKQALDLMPPSLKEDIQAKAIESFFARSGKKIGANDVSRAFAGQVSQVPSAVGMVKALGDKAGVERLKLLVGPEKFEDLRQYAHLIAGTEYKYAASGYTMAGAFAATHTVKALENLELLKFAKPTIANWVLAKILTNGAFRRWAGNIPKNPDPGAMSLFFTSPTFLSEVSKDFDKSGAQDFISGLKEAMDKWASAKSQTPQAPPKKDWQAELMEMKPNPNAPIFNGNK